MNNDKYSNALELDEKRLKLTPEMYEHIRHHINNDLAVINILMLIMSKDKCTRTEKIEIKIKEISKYLINIKEFVEENHEN